MKNIIFKKTNKHNKGFTLIETLVSLALFTVVLVIAGGTIVSVIDINKRNQAISSVVNNLNYSIDSMVRDIKTGYLYKCDYIGQPDPTIQDLKDSSVLGECSNGKSITLISTISGTDVVVRYEFIPQSGQNGYINKTVYTAGGAGSSYSITDQTNVNIEDLKFSVKNPDPLDCDKTLKPCNNYGQPSVAVVIKGKAGNQTIEVSKFYVQTFISQRLINVTDFNDNN